MAAVVARLPLLHLALSGSSCPRSTSRSSSCLTAPLRLAALAVAALLQIANNSIRHLCHSTRRRSSTTTTTKKTVNTAAAAGSTASRSSRRSPPSSTVNTAAAAGSTTSSTDSIRPKRLVAPSPLAGVTVASLQSGRIPTDTHALWIARTASGCSSVPTLRTHVSSPAAGFVARRWARKCWRPS